MEVGGGAVSPFIPNLPPALSREQILADPLYRNWSCCMAATGSGEVCPPQGTPRSCPLYLKVSSK